MYAWLATTHGTHFDLVEWIFWAVINGQIEPANIALALEDICWDNADHWMRLQASYELAQAR